MLQRKISVEPWRTQINCYSKFANAKYFYIKFKLPTEYIFF